MWQKISAVIGSNRLLLMGIKLGLRLVVFTTEADKYTG